MSLECVLVTRDPALLSTLRSNCSPVGIELQIFRDGSTAVQVASKRHFDGFFVDCDQAGVGTSALRKLHCTNSNRQSVIFAVVSGKTSVTAAFDEGASFVLSKPVDGSQLRRVLDAAVSRMEREHRRYCRYTVEVPVQLRRASGGLMKACALNVSEGGMAINLSGQLEAGELVDVEFKLGQYGQFAARAEIVWVKVPRTGLRFLRIEPTHEVPFSQWLQSLSGDSHVRRP